MTATSRSSPPNPRVVTLAVFANEVRRRRAIYEAEHGPLVIARNSGERRTPEKRALLEEVDRLAAAKGFRW